MGDLSTRARAVAQIVANKQWMARAEGLARELALPCKLDVANDPFFGKVGQMMAVSQRQNALEFALLIPFQPPPSLQRA